MLQPNTAFTFFYMMAMAISVASASHGIVFGDEPKTNDGASINEAADAIKDVIVRIGKATRDVFEPIHDLTYTVDVALALSSTKGQIKDLTSEPSKELDRPHYHKAFGDHIASEIESHRKRFKNYRVCFARLEIFIPNRIGKIESGKHQLAPDVFIVRRNVDLEDKEKFLRHYTQRTSPPEEATNHADEEDAVSYILEVKILNYSKREDSDRISATLKLSALEGFEEQSESNLGVVRFSGCLQDRKWVVAESRK
jgi:hypothetical protein